MDKKGFTLIEISISVALLSVVLLFVINLLTVIRRNEDEIGIDTKLEINKAIISKTINEDILENEGIKEITCESELSCDIVLNKDDALRKIYIAPVTETNSDGDRITITVLHYEEKDTSGNTTKVLFTRKSLEGYYYKLSLEEKTLVNILTVVVEDHPAYNIEIVSSTENN